MKKPSTRKRFDWTIVIPILFWLICIISSLLKLLHTGTEFQIKNIVDIIEYLKSKWLIIYNAGALTILDIFNSNTFSTYVSMVICLLYQSFTTEKQKDQKIPNDLKPLAFFTTIVYGVFFLINVCIFNIVTTLIVTIMSIIYVAIFFKKLY